MNFKEYGSKDKDTILLLHGGGLSWWNYREVARLLEQDYHVILPILDGHAGSDHPFTTIEENAAEIITFLDEHYHGSILLMGGLSLGAQILIEILSQRKDICSYALIESASVLPSKALNTFITPSLNLSYGLIKNKSFAKLQFQSLHIKEDLFEDYYRDTCQIKKEDMIEFLKANTSYSLKNCFKEATAKIHVYVGEKETNEIIHSAERICEKHASSELHRLPNLRHGEFSINNPTQYVDAIRKILKNA